MHDEQSLDRMNPNDALGIALRALPDASPAHDAWPLLAIRAQRTRRRRRLARFVVPAALAAGLALVVAWPLVHEHFAGTPNTHLAQTPNARTATGDAAAQLASLRTHSQDLQGWVRQLQRAAGPVSGSALAEIAELEDRIGLIDLQLGVATEPGLQAALWKQRISLLRQLGVLRLAPAEFATASLSSSTRARPADWLQ